MIEKDRVIEAFTRCMQDTPDCAGCPYRPEAYEDQLVCIRGPIADAARLLQEDDNACD